MGFLKILIVAVIVIVLAASGLSYWLYSSLTSPQQHAKADEWITIEKGSTPAQIIDKLAAEGIVSGGTPLKIYLRTIGDAGNLQAGEYQFRSPISALEVLKELEKGESRTIRLTIPEGFTRFDIAKRIAERTPQNPVVDEKSILTLMDDTSSIKDIAPEAKNLEGYMYPSTYSLPREAKPHEIIAAMVTQFKKIWRPEWNERAKALGRTPHEIVTIASLVETESGVEADRKSVV